MHWILVCHASIHSLLIYAILYYILWHNVSTLKHHSSFIFHPSSLSVPSSFIWLSFFVATLRVFKIHWAIFSITIFFLYSSACLLCNVRKYFNTAVWFPFLLTIQMFVDFLTCDQMEWSTRAAGTLYSQEHVVCS